MHGGNMMMMGGAGMMGGANNMARGGLMMAPAGGVYGGGGGVNMGMGMAYGAMPQQPFGYEVPPYYIYVDPYCTSNPQVLFIFPCHIISLRAANIFASPSKPAPQAAAPDPFANLGSWK
jgi:hypothetical protein